MRKIEERISAGYEGDREKMKKIAPTKNERETLKIKRGRFDGGEEEKKGRRGRV